MFRGSYEHTIDPKGRLSIPARFREELSARNVDALVLAAGDRCVWAFPLDEWERLEEKLRQHPQLSPEMRHFLRMTVGSAKDCPVDRAGQSLSTALELLADRLTRFCSAGVAAVRVIQ